VQGVLIQNMQNNTKDSINTKNKGKINIINLIFLNISKGDKFQMKTKVKAVFKIFMLCAYCSLICAAILLSFRSLFGLFAG